MLFARAARRIFLCAARPLFRFRVEKAERLPASGPVIVIAAHRSWLDPPLVAGACSRPVSFMILSTVYHRWGMRWLFRGLRTIPVDPGGATAIGSLRSAVRRLERGECLGVFPEGRVVPRAGEGTIHPGAAMLSVRTGAPVVPLAIFGSARAWPHGKTFPRPVGVRVRFGRPIFPPAGSRTDARREMLRRIEVAILEGPEGDDRDEG